MRGQKKKKIENKEERREVSIAANTQTSPLFMVLLYNLVISIYLFKVVVIFRCKQALWTQM